MSLAKYLNLQKQIQNYKEDEEALKAVMFEELCGVNPHDLQKIDTHTVEQMTSDLNSFMSQTEHPLHPIVEIEGKEYGLVPDLSQIEYGAYLDITKYDTIQIDENWSKIMNILYRPVTSKRGVTYDVEGYTATEEGHEKWLSVGMDIHLGVYFFLWNLQQDLVTDTLNSMRKEKNLPTHIKSTLDESGEAISQLLNSQRITLWDLMKS